MLKADEYKRTIVYGESALSYIKRYSLSAVPRSYEFWYTYSAGYNFGLNRAINQILADEGSVSSEQMLAIYGKYLSPARLGDRLDEVGSKVTSEVDGLVDALKIGMDATADYGKSLEAGAAELPTLTSQENLEGFLAKMIKETQTALTTNRQLENQLVESKLQIESLQANLEAIRYETLTDELTGLGNRKHFDETLQRHLDQANDVGSDFVLILTDIDHFKSFNDRYGHQTGDQVLRLVAQTVKQNVKGHDIACRYGGEEFAIILPDCALDQAMEISERIRTAVQSKELVKRSTGENLGRVTISIGVAMFRTNDTDETIIARADAALYAAKNKGRNKLCSERELPESAETNNQDNAVA